MLDADRLPYLPLRLGGLGLARTWETPDAAYVPSWWESSHRSPFVLSRDSVIPAIGRIQSLGADCKLEDLKFHPPSARIQNQLMENISNRTFGEMKDGCRSHEDWASLQASRQLGTAYFLTILPTASWCTFSDEEWILLCRSRLGMRVSLPTREVPDICTACNGGHAIDTRLRHSLRCGHQSL